jgi:hypothetical protein
MCQRLSDVENALMGAAGGALEVTCFQSLNYCKNATQQGLSLTLDPRVLYRGYASNVLNMGGGTMVQYVAGGRIKSWLTGGDKRRALSDNENILAGFGAGCVSAALIGPLELIMIQQQNKGGSILSHKGTILSPHIVRGFASTAFREGIWTIGYMSLPPIFRSYLREHHGETFQTEDQARLAASLASAFISAGISHPFDTVKTCMQGDIERVKFTTLTKTARTIYKESGPTAFYRGFLWRYARQVGAIFLLDRFFSIVPSMVYPERFQDE